MSRRPQMTARDTVAEFFGELAEARDAVLIAEENLYWAEVGSYCCEDCDGGRHLWRAAVAEAEAELAAVVAEAEAVRRLARHLPPARTRWSRF